MAVSPLRILHAIHDFLPRHQAGSEIYAYDLCRTLLDRGHHVTLTCASFNPAQPHGHVHWRVYGGLPVVEITNNWLCQGFEDTYRSPMMRSRLESVLQAVQPDVVHVHNLLDLTFDLPRLAHDRGSRVVATLHDYTLVCPSGGQRVHKAERHVCRTIDPARCARCFGESALGTRAAFGRLARRPLVAAPLAIAAGAVRALAPRLTEAVSNHLPTLPATVDDIARRLDAARAVFDEVDLFVSPSASLASEFIRLGLPAHKLRVSDYGFRPRGARTSRAHNRPLRIGFVGTPVWHKGVHLLVDAVRQLAADSFTVTIFGDLDIFPDYAADLRARAAGLPVHFAGAFTRAEADLVYDQIDLLVVPSLWLENSPLVIHEALMAGIPVIGSNIGGIPDLIAHDRNGLLFEAGNADALAAALREALTVPDLLPRLAAAESPIKSLEDDASEWERAYEQVVVDAAPVVAVS
jgi:glycosyltransferase involved in cell wall biosynthesis